MQTEPTEEEKQEKRAKLMKDLEFYCVHYNELPKRMQKIFDAEIKYIIGELKKIGR